MASLRLHKKFGAAPTIPICYICGEDKNEVVLLGASWKGDQAPPMHMCIDAIPCEKCQEFMAQGVICLSVRDGETSDNPYRTGRIAVVKEDAVREMFAGDVDVSKQRIVYIHDSAWTAFGLPG